MYPGAGFARNPKFAISNRSPSDPASVDGRLSATRRGYTDAGSVQAKAGRNGDAKAQIGANYDDANANPYPNLPDVMKLAIGEQVASPEQWKVRRAEIVELSICSMENLPGGNAMAAIPMSRTLSTSFTGRASDLPDRTTANRPPVPVMSDALHPSTKGYEIWADAVNVPLGELMKFDTASAK